MADQSISNYERELAIDQIEKQIGIDAHYAKRLSQVKHRMGVMHELQRHLYKLQHTNLA